MSVVRVGQDRGVAAPETVLPAGPVRTARLAAVTSLAALPSWVWPISPPLALDLPPPVLATAASPGAPLLLLACSSACISASSA
eukprot:scaffold4384_cov367-Prasinococcus_capsulatus_cf.AAC.9